MVVQWVDDDTLRRQTRKRLETDVDAFEPDVVLAHSLGSLVAYDAFSLKEGRARLRGRSLVTFGSQIGNAFVRGSFGGRIRALEADHWFHLFNDEDAAFTSRIRLADERFREVDTFFDVDGMLDHEAEEYLAHPSAVSSVWRELAAPARGMRALRGAVRAVGSVGKRTERRALLVGIDEYPDEKDWLAGCKNDVFLMSSLLQETGFDPEDIRVVLDKRATASAIRSRLEWLLDGTRDGDERFFFYSGHGAQIPAYGIDETVDGVDECLVPYDFDWSLERAVVDDQFRDLYAQLPYDSRFVAVLDCCHSGGMHRDGGPRVRGLSPPDDIRHRELRWHAEREMWTERELPEETRDLAKREEFTGVSGAKRRLGRAVSLRTIPDREFDREREERGHYGPYFPIILQACQEAQLASEYRHGVVSYGAFTYSLVKSLRRRRTERKPVTFRGLVRIVQNELEALGYEQVPQVVGPSVLLGKAVPWSATGRRK
jgi:hypothetical protein